MRLIIILFFIIIVSSCSTTRKCVVEQERNNNTDIFESTYTETTSFVTDTVYVTLPERESERVTTDSISHLENEYSYSDAIIKSDGSLFHNLIILPKNIPKEIKKPVTEIKENKSKIKQRTITITKTVTKEVIPISFRIWAVIGKIMTVLLSIIVIAIYLKSIFKKFR